MYQQNYGGYYPQQTYLRAAPPQQANLKGRPVSSIDEARASAIDFDGSIFYFPDLANKRIYTKQINIDGTSILNMYELKEIPVDKPIDQTSFVTRDEFELAIQQLRSSLIPPVIEPAPAQINVPVPMEQKPPMPQIKF